MPDEGAPFGRSTLNDLVNKPIVRTYEEERKWIHQVKPYKFEIKEGFVPGKQFLY